MRDRGVFILRSSVSLSLALHALFIAACLIMVGQRAVEVRAPRQLTWIELENPLDKIKARQEEEKLRNKVVQTREATEAKVAAKDAFLGAKTQTVDRETVSRKHSTQMGETAVVQPTSQAQKARSQKERAKAQAMPPGVLTKFGLQMIPTLKEAEENQKNERDEPRWAAQGGSPEDWVKGVKESDRTLLNTKEYVFYGYFQRIRSRLDRAWIPILRARLTALYKSGRHLASDMDHTTRVLVVLNHGGEVTAVKVQRESGTQDLDDAAVRAFNAAGPFPNPPRGIVDPNGQIQIPWEFILKS